MTYIDLLATLMLGFVLGVAVARHMRRPKPEPKAEPQRTPPSWPFGIEVVSSPHVAPGTFIIGHGWNGVGFDETLTPPIAFIDPEAVATIRVDRPER